MRTTHLARTLAVLAMTGAWACGNDPTTGPTRLGVRTITVVPRTATIGAGQAIHLTAKLVDEFGDPLDVAVTWSSSNESVATVSVAGNVFGHSAGRAAITASAHGGRAQSASVQVIGDEPRAKPKPLLARTRLK